MPTINRKTLTIIILTVIWALLFNGSPRPATAAPNQATTHLPFGNSQNLLLPGAQPDYQLYPAGNRGYLAVTYQTDVASDHRHVLVQILDSQGKQLHQSIIKRPGYNTVQLVHQWGAGFLLVLTNQINNQESIYLIKINERAQEQWVKNYPGQSVYSVAGTNDQGLIIAGHQDSNTTGRDLCIAKLNREGHMTAAGSKDAHRWLTTLELSGNQTPRHITQVLDLDGYNDGYIITGYSTNQNSDTKELLLVRLDAYGKLKWQRTYSGKGQAEGIFVLPVYTDNDELQGYLVAGHSSSGANETDKELYLLHTDSSGYKTRWPGALRIPDGQPEKYFGSDSPSYQVAALYQVPDSFKDNRKHRGQDIPGPGGYVLTAIYTDGGNRGYVDLFRINELGQYLWEKNISVPSGTLTLTTPWASSDNYLRLIYAYGFTDQSDTSIQFHTLEHYLEGILKDDKSIPQDDQKETNYEAIKWETVDLEFVGYTDTGKEIKKLLQREKLPAVKPQALARSHGQIIWPDTSVYLGQLKLGKANGEGLLVFPDGTWYKGQWQQNMFSGQGALHMPTGENYNGSFKDHSMTGYGVFKWPTGQSYHGQFKNNLRHGQGKFTWPGGVYYEGDFENDLAHGFGQLVWPSGEKYVGNMRSGQPGGQGEYYFPNGEWYRGAFSGLAFNGVGTYHWPDGSLYVGSFVQNRFTGQGCYYWPDGVQQCGYWRNDVFLGTENPDNFPWLK